MQVSVANMHLLNSTGYSADERPSGMHSGHAGEFTTASPPDCMPRVLLSSTPPILAPCAQHTLEEHIQSAQPSSTAGLAPSSVGGGAELSNRSASLDLPELDAGGERGALPRLSLGEDANGACQTPSRPTPPPDRDPELWGLFLPSAAAHGRPRAHTCRTVVDTMYSSTLRIGMGCRAARLITACALCDAFSPHEHATCARNTQRTWCTLSDLFFTSVSVRSTRLAAAGDGRLGARLAAAISCDWQAHPALQ